MYKKDLLIENIENLIQVMLKNPNSIYNNTKILEVKDNLFKLIHFTDDKSQPYHDKVCEGLYSMCEDMTINGSPEVYLYIFKNMIKILRSEYIMDECLGFILDDIHYRLHDFVMSIKEENQSIRGNRAKRCVSGYDKEVILIDKETQKPYYGCYMNMYNKIYWFDADMYLTWLKEDKYDKYDVRVVD